MLLADWREAISVSDMAVALAPAEGSASAPASPAFRPRHRRVAALPAPEQTPLTPLIEHLRQRRYADAVRFVVDACSNGTVEPDSDLAENISRLAGPEISTKLISAFARFPCQACQSGIDVCPICTGNGIRAERVVCEHCVGSGMIRCDFCGGSGLSSYEMVPIKLRYPVLLHRVKIACAQTRSLLAWPMPSREIELLHVLWNYNKLLAVLESAIVAAGLLAAHDQKIADNVNSLWQTCLQTSNVIEPNLRAALRKLGELCGSITQTNNSGDSAIAIRKSTFYDNLAVAPSFRGTCLHHPYLRATPTS